MSVACHQLGYCSIINILSHTPKFLTLAWFILTITSILQLARENAILLKCMERVQEREIIKGRQKEKREDERIDSHHWFQNI